MGAVRPAQQTLRKVDAIIEAMRREQQEIDRLRASTRAILERLEAR